MGHLGDSFGPSPGVVPDARSLPLESVEMIVQVATARRTVEISAASASSAVGGDVPAHSAVDAIRYV